MAVPVPAQESMAIGITKAIVEQIQCNVLQEFEQDGVKHGNFMFFDYNKQVLSEASTAKAPKHYTTLSTAKVYFLIQNGGNQNTLRTTDYCFGQCGYYCCIGVPNGGYCCVKMGCKKTFNGQGAVLINTADQKKYVAVVSTNIMEDNKDLAFVEHAIGSLAEMRKELDGSWYYFAGNAQQLPTSPQDEKVESLGWLDPSVDRSVPPELCPETETWSEDLPHRRW